jgi:mono/diheme cytochrome c family protein
MTRNRTIAAAGIAAFVLLGYLALQASGKNAATTASIGHGDIDTLKAAYDNWRGAYEHHGGSPEVLKLTIGYSKALSKTYTEARGRLEFNLMDGRLAFNAGGMKDGRYGLWFMDNGDNPGNTVRPDAQDKFIHIGELDIKHGKGGLRRQLTREQLAGFSLDSVVVTPAGKTPLDEVLITGSPDLMTKLYYASQHWPIAELDRKQARERPLAATFEFLLPKVAIANTVSDLAPVLGEQVALGRQIFHNETFSGNGRNCGTCHREDNNFTIDPNFIAKLPANDPLFVAETNPMLAELENPELMRKLGLILTNIDGAGTPVFRSVPHTLSMATTIVSENTRATAPFVPGEFEADNAFQAATGWSGDGAPGAGTLREFATGAVVQHFPKTMARNSDPNDAIPDDLRLPTDAELDAIEAYTLSLGRSKDYPLWKLTFSDALTQAGKLLFDTRANPCTNGSAQSGGPSPPPTCNGEPISTSNVALGTTANCNGCHQHGGGRSSTTFANPTRDTGVEKMKINPARLLNPDVAFDGGFGQIASTCGPNNDQPCFGDGRFNTPPLIEAADTAPYFHNNSVSTLEEAVAMYNSDAFNFSPGAVTGRAHDRRVKLDATQITAVASFLRAVNALENIRLSNRLDNQARQVANNTSARQLARLAIRENQDAIHVLKEGKVLGGYAEAIKKLDTAGYFQSLAQVAPGQALRNRLLQQAIAAKQEAKALIATCDENAARPSTVGGSPAGFVFSCTELDTL